MRDTYEAVVKEFGGKLNRSGVLGLLRSLGVHDGPAAAGADSEPLDLLWGELGFGAEGTPVRGGGAAQGGGRAGLGARAVL